MLFHGRSGTAEGVLNQSPTAFQLVDSASQKAPVQQLMTKVTSVNEPREALLSSDVQNGPGGILAAATSVATGHATPQAAADALQKAAVAAGEHFK